LTKNSSASAFNLGAGRSTNEDLYQVNDKLGLYMISDGTSVAFGKWAAETTCAKVEESFQKNKEQIEQYNETLDRSLRFQLVELMDSALQSASHFIYSEIQNDPKKNGSFAAISAVLILRDCFIIGHVGNCRVYHFRNGKISLLTKDHTRYQQMLDAGFGAGNVNPAFKKDLTQVIGIQHFVQSKAFTVALVPDDDFLLCSDGLYDGLKWESKFEPKELKDLPFKTAFADIPKSLVQAAVSKGASDNISALVIHVDAATKDMGKEVSEPLKTVGIQLQVESLRKLSLFSSFKDDEATMLKIHSITTSQKFKKGSMLMEQGVKGDRIFAILSGKVNILINGVVIRQSGTGEFLGEIGFFTEEPRSATVIASEDVQVLVMLKQDLDRMIVRDKDLGLKIYLCAIFELSHKLRERG
jgi:serine/threonine protein phosphatase PrpC